MRITIVLLCLLFSGCGIKSFLACGDRGSCACDGFLCLHDICDCSGMKDRD